MKNSKRWTESERPDARKPKTNKIKTPPPKATRTQKRRKA